MVLSEKEVRQILQETEMENIRLKTENAAATATLNQERDRARAYEDKIMHLETSLDALNRQIRDREAYVSQIEQNLHEKNYQLERKDQEKVKQLRKLNSKMVEETEKKDREMQAKLNEERRNMREAMRTKDEKLRLVTDIVNSDTIAPQPVSNLIHRFNSNCENVQPPQSERKARPRVGYKIFLILSVF